MNFKPSENEEKYFKQLELERRRAAEERRGRTSGSHGRVGSVGTGRHATESGATDAGDGQEG
jgi:hypothetical protein